MREPYNITFNQYRNTVTMPYIEFVVGDYMTCPLSFKWMKNDIESFNQSGTKVYLVVQTPSGKSIDDRCTINDADAGISNILLKQDFVIEKGLHRAELQAIDVESGIVRMTSPSFSYNVRKSLQDSNTEEAKNALTQLQEALNAASNIEEIRDIATTAIEQSNDIVTKIKKDGVILTTDANQSIANNESTKKIWKYSNGYKNVGTYFFNIIEPTKITINTEEIKKVRLKASAIWNYDSNEVGFRELGFYKNGVDFKGSNVHRGKSHGGTQYNLATTAILDVQKGDYFEVFVRQTSGVALTLSHSGGGFSTWFELEVIE